MYFRAPDISTANRLVAGMSGIWGAAIPEPILSHLGFLRPILEGMGIGSFLGGGSTFIETWLWVAAAAWIAFLVPNTQEILWRFEPALPVEGQAIVRPAARLVWQPCRRDAVLSGLLFALGLLALSRPTEFLYFQF